MHERKAAESIEKIIHQARLKLGRSPKNDLEAVKLSGYEQGVLMVCPFCHYHDERGKERRTAKIFGRLFKCFACGIVRRVEDDSV